MLKKYMTTLLALVLTLGLLAGCGAPGSRVATSEPSEAKKLSVVTTIFPEYDWVRQILGDKASDVELTLLLDSGVDLHSYQPTADDMVKIATCDLFVYVGGESDEWVEDALNSAANKEIVAVNLLEVLGDTVKEEEVVEGMEHDHHHEHEDEEIQEDEVKDRALDEFAGEWKSLAPMLAAGELDKFVEYHADEHGEPQAEVREELTEKWNCDANTIAINGDTITFTYGNGDTVSAKYMYAGYALIQDDDGDITGVRYQFETDSDNAPKYLQINDHQHEPGEVEHFHIYFGNDGFDALLNSKSNPFFVPSNLDADGVLEELMGGHDHGHDEHEEEPEYDEHVWLSLKNAKKLVEVLAEKLGALDSANASVYTANAKTYAEKLDALDSEYEAAVKAGTYNTVLFGDRFPFRYLVDDYGLNYYAAFVGCSAESEASFETVAFLANKVDELGLPTVLTIESGDGKIAQTIVETTKSKTAQILAMDSLQSTTKQDVEAGATYLGAMEQNLNVLKQALQ